MDIDWQGLGAHIEAATGRPFAVVGHRRLGGGDINAAYRLEGAGRCYFGKFNHADRADMFAAEWAGLKALAASGTVRVPAPVATGVVGRWAFLVLEHLELAATSSPAANHLAAGELGAQLAALHRLPCPYFGWHRDNTIGSTPQTNTPAADWPSFWRDHRLGAQLRLAAANGYGGALQRQGERLCADLAAFFDGHQPQPSLVHGDLWGGNWAVDSGGTPVVFDPACYYGDRETDLAMTELFGGFTADFYAAYQAAWPLAEGYRSRKTLYNLYHVLNHLNLFGGGYLKQAERHMAQLLAQLR